jgi:hypothetical protein
MGILTIPFLLLTKVATAQNYEVAPAYEEMPKIVQEQMNSNKQNGVDLYKNVIGTIVINVDGLESSKHAELKSKLTKMSQVKSVTINNNKIVVVIDGGTPLVILKKAFTGFITAFNLVSSTYTVSK